MNEIRRALYRGLSGIAKAFGLTKEWKCFEQDAIFKDIYLSAILECCKHIEEIEDRLDKIRIALDKCPCGCSSAHSQDGHNWTCDNCGKTRYMP